jgi:hypothetical protein
VFQWWKIQNRNFLCKCARWSITLDGVLALLLSVAAVAAQSTTPVVADVLREWYALALQATPTAAPLAHQRLLDTQQRLAQFLSVVFDIAGATVVEQLRQQQRRRKRSADRRIAVMALAGQPILVTRDHAEGIIRL